MSNTSDGTSVAPPLGGQIEERAGPLPPCDPEVGTALDNVIAFPSGAPPKERRSSRSAPRVGRDALDELWGSVEARDAPAGVPPVVVAALERAALERRAGVLCVLRVAEYRVLEETFGQAVGRQLGGIVERRLRAAVRAEDVVARIADDEFALVLDGLARPEDAAAMAERLLRSCQGVYQLERLRLHVGASVGIASYPGDARTPGELLRWARLALHTADPQRRASYEFFSPALLERLRERVWLAAELEEALAQGRLVLHYQPLFAVDTQRTVGAEALLRLRSGSGELIGPDRFIPLAEAMGLIVPIGQWVLREACRQLGLWRRQGIGPLHIAVNVSPRQLADARFVEVVSDAVAAAGIEHRDLVLEITEGQVVRNLPLVAQVFGTLSARGVQIAVDDFGTGYSALAYLARLPLNTVKIDRSFLAAIPEDRKAAQIVAAIIAMATQLGLGVTAEGIETEAQYRFLFEAGCPWGQGFGFARPQTVQAFPHCLLSPPPWGEDKP